MGIVAYELERSGSSLIPESGKMVEVAAWYDDAIPYVPHRWSLIGTRYCRTSTHVPGSILHNHR